MPHPRTYGAFPRMLGRLRREFPTVTLEGMVHRMTDRPAQRFGITQRGRIQKGYFADVTLFDAERVIDTATFDDLAPPPGGIPYVLVNGQVAVDNDPLHRRPRRPGGAVPGTARRIASGAAASPDEATCSPGEPRRSCLIRR